MGKVKFNNKVSSDKIPMVSKNTDKVIKKPKKKHENRKNKLEKLGMNSQMLNGVNVKKVDTVTRGHTTKEGDVLKSSDEKLLDKYCVLWNRHKNKNDESSIVIKPGTNWVDEVIGEVNEERPIPIGIRKKLKEHAKKLYENDLEAYRAFDEQQSRSGDKKYQKTMLRNGTTKDKITALVLQCLDSPLHTIAHLHAIIEYICPKLRHFCNDVMNHINKLLKSAYLPGKKIAREFECHNFRTLIPLIQDKNDINNDIAHKQLLLWYFEDELRRTYMLLVGNLARLSHDQVTKTKSLGIRGLQNLVIQHPGQCSEAVLRELVNKLGDSVPRVVGSVSHGLGVIQAAHPHIRPIMVSLVEELLYRSHINNKTQYSCITFLTNIKLDRKDLKLPSQLVKIYFDFFQTCSKKGDVDNKFMGALLCGLNRAFPFIGQNSKVLDEQLDILYRLCHMVNFNVASQTLQLIYQVQRTSNTTSSRFYQAIYSKILDPDFGNSVANSAFLNLLFKAMSKDPSIPRMRAFIKRLLQVAKYQSPQTICAILFLISEMSKDNPVITRLNDVLVAGDAKTFVKTDDIGSDSEEECYPDLDTDSEGEGNKPLKLVNKSQVKKDISRTESKKSKTASWIHRNNINGNINGSATSPLRKTVYDPFSRNPEFCGANLTSIWELTELSEHYHPSVSMFSSKLLECRHVEYTGDPLKDFTLTRFIDRFIMRNPKEVKQDIVKISMHRHKDEYKPMGKRALLVNSKAFIDLEEKNVPVEDKFFHQYFNKYERSREKINKLNKEEDVDDDEFDEYLQKTSGLDEEEIDFAKNALKIAKESEEQESGDDDEEEGLLGGKGEEDNSDEDMEEEPEFPGEDNEDESDEGDAEFENVDDTMADGEDIFDGLDLDDDNFDLSDEDNEKPAKKVKKEKIKKFKEKSTLKEEKNKKFKVRSNLKEIEDDAGDDFARILEDSAAQSGRSMGTSDEVFNRDKSHAKQMKWEERRHKSFGRGRGRSRGGGRGRGR